MEVPMCSSVARAVGSSSPSRILPVLANPLLAAGILLRFPCPDPTLEHGACHLHDSRTSRSEFAKSAVNPGVFEEIAGSRAGRGEARVPELLPSTGNTPRCDIAAIALESSGLSRCYPRETG